MYMMTLTGNYAVVTLCGIAYAVLFFILTFFPFSTKERVTGRMKIMMGGRWLAYSGLFGIYLQAAVIIFLSASMKEMGIPQSVIIANSITSEVVAMGFMFNGVIRMFFTSKRLNIIRRIVTLLTFAMPVANLFVISKACRLVRDEYHFEKEKAELREARANSEICKTKYPIVLVHGIFFKDRRYFNYWGRIPAELIRNGATLFYGNQEAAGTTVVSGEEIKDAIIKAMEETGSEKVNIIAHSKGGLDARYAISALGMGKYVASLTTVGTPHRGCAMVDKLCRVPEGIYRWVAKVADKAFSSFGDTHSDFYNSTHELTTVQSRIFNENIPDYPGVYYQSYASMMKSGKSFRLLGISYRVIKKLEGDNDGLVSVESAKWGDFRKTYVSTTRRGVSHGDTIDLKREDYRGFDVVEQYVELVSDLKNKGF